MIDRNTTEIARRPALADRFFVLDKLGEGAGSNVYLVTDSKRNNQQVALKVLQNFDAFDEHTFERFIVEMETCRELRHPNLIEAYDFIDLGDSIAFTMEFVPGADLGMLLSRADRMSGAEVDRVFIDILKALEQLHEKDIVHRDLKLENILIREDGVVKLSDLGLMKKLDEEGLTKPGILLGTVHYMPPEYVTRGKYDARSDLYCVAIMLLEILTQKRRLEGFEGREVITELIRTNFEISPALLQSQPRKYQEIVLKGTQRDPAARYQTAQEMRKDLERQHGEFLSEGTTVVESQLEFDKVVKRFSKEQPSLFSRIWALFFS